MGRIGPCGREKGSQRLAGCRAAIRSWRLVGLGVAPERPPALFSQPEQPGVALERAELEASHEAKREATEREIVRALKQVAGAGHAPSPALASTSPTVVGRPYSSTRIMPSSGCLSVRWRTTQPV